MPMLKASDIRQEVVEITANYIRTSRSARHKTEKEIRQFLINSKVVDLTIAEIDAAYEEADK